MRLFTCLLFALVCSLISAQTGAKKELFSEGVYFFNREEYSEAAYYFKQLVTAEPSNAHYNFRLGECYMNTPGSETQAIPYFEVAVKNMAEKKKYRYGDLNEVKAPLHALFYLGNVYRIAGRLQDALKSYETFINSPWYSGNYNLNVVENEIRSCEHAKIIMDSPVNVNIEPLDSLINTTASEIHPVVTHDEQTMVFIRRLKFYDAILMVTRQGDSWSSPVNLNPQIGSDGEYYPVSFSHDGNSLFLVRDKDNNKDLYVSHKVNGLWSKAKPLGKAVNSVADETWACLSPDGRTLWFTSARRGGQGGQDIYTATLDKNGAWKKVKNAGKVINTQFDEESPYITANNRVLYFSSKGHTGMGGYDIFRSEFEDKAWGKPVNIGYPVNNTTDNTGFTPVRDNAVGYYSMDDPEGNNDWDVYRVVFRNHSTP